MIQKSINGNNKTAPVRVFHIDGTPYRVNSEKDLIKTGALAKCAWGFGGESGCITKAAEKTKPKPETIH